MAKINESEKYKWEFLRRNKKYIKTYNKYIEYKKSARYKESDEEDVFEFYSSWQISKPLDPAKSYEENLESIPATNKNIFFPAPLSLTLDSGYDEACALIWGEFMLDIGFSKRAIVKKFKQYLEHYIKSYKGSLKIEGDYKQKQKKARFPEYKRYLQVYDLREKGWNWKKLANKFYKGVIEKVDLDYGRKLIRRDYKRCKIMIDGEYGQLS